MNCDKCGRRIVQPAGPVSSPILLVGESPAFEELKEGVPLIGRSGQVLRDEMSRAGMSIERCRRTNLWLHTKSDDCDLDWHVTQLLREMMGRKAVLLMGSEVLTVFLPGEMVSECNGLEIMSPQLPRCVEICYAMFNPAIALYDKLGEIRFGIRQFVAAAKEYV